MSACDVWFNGINDTAYNITKHEMHPKLIDLVELCEVRVEHTLVYNRMF